MMTRGTKIALAIVVGWACLVGIGVLMLGLKKGGFLTLTDVGELPELADLQSKLGPLDLCAVEYAGRDKRGHRGHFEYLYMHPCSGDRSDPVLLKVDPAWGYKKVGYELERGGPDQRWRVLVEKEEIPFPDLLGALGDHVPVMAAEYAGELAEDRATSQRWDEEDAKRRAEEAARKAGAAGSYPTR